MMSSGGEFFALVVAIFGVFTTFFWMMVGYRAMRAHEDIADVLRGRAKD